MEVQRSKLKEEPYISGAHIRGIVKQLSSSRSRSNAPAIVEDPTTSQPKKKVRRRLNTSRPCQERLLNMAEVRREIVTALKSHREAMRKSSVQQQEKEKLYHAPSQKSSFNSQPLGLNLNFQGFSNVETLFLCNSNNININNNKSPLIHLPTSSSTSTSTSSSNPADSSLHRVMDDEEMEEIRSISKKHDIEWNDIMNSVKTAWWSKLLKAMEVDGDGDGENIEGDAWITNVQ